MKKLFLLLAPALLTATNATAETSLVSGIKTNLAIATSVKAAQYQISLSQTSTEEQKKYSPIEDTILNPENVIAYSGQTIEEIIAENNKIIESAVINDGSLLLIEKSIEEIIVEDNKIIESNIAAEVYPLLLERTIEDVIDENNQIIDSPAIEVHPLDFKAIDRKTTGKPENKLLIGMN